MKTAIRTSLMVCVMMTIFTVSALAQKVNVEYDHQATFTSYHTYRWGKNKDQLPDVGDDAQIKSAIDKQLQAKGLRLVNSSPADLVVTYQATVDSQGKQVDTYLDNDNLGLGPGWGGPGWGGWGPGWGWGWGDFGPSYATSTISTIQNGDLLIDLVDPAKKKIVFRAYASGTFQSNPIKEDQQMDKAVDKIFKQFPPKKK
jgi:Domain of unknown function (DUF4136)